MGRAQNIPLSRRCGEARAREGRRSRGDAGLVLAAGKVAPYPAPRPLSTALRSPLVKPELRDKLEATTRWDPAAAERGIFERWLEGGYFHPEPTGDPDSNY